jgi:enolase-phosphatase E1
VIPLVTDGVWKNIGFPVSVFVFLLATMMLLFPYVRDHIAEFVRCHAEDPHVVALLNDVRLQAGEDLDLEGIITTLQQWIDTDQKITALKALQGMIWKAGLRNGDFTGNVYPDAVENLHAWHDQGIALYIFSLGSVQAQKLLFGYSDAGDLTSLLSGYFDSRMGAKREPRSYTTIAEQIATAPEHILFLSDIKEELDAARHAGMQTTWLVRDGEPDPDAGQHQVTRFDQIDLENLYQRSKPVAPVS